ncbi:outer membrane beta-barrel protein [Novosphingobium album (ex Liu et al. 2023)]|uniref:Outer membrane beta-barrel protein n=1 Tax=Novosphingobium album (ex Liu et al. 2023) TaxID=3031130 RepID=A0ABT5WQH5_9SPHN|nr:outer membrane beta-barrel protein [Novosphingobium album (ex Liu et al. 2023)]MDE8652292.1 outer membrane beta-barrel protein [Novosphingobium album (ex Liu et al. 2023)]
MVANLLFTVLLIPIMTGTARAQSSESVLIDTATPEGLPSDKGNDVRRTPSEWAPLGSRIGAFALNSQVTLANGITSNTFQTSSSPKASSFLVFSPQADLRSNWSRHQVRLYANGDFARYVGRSDRNEDRWNLVANGRIDASSKLELNAEVSASQQTRNRFSGDIDATGAYITVYRQDALALNATYASGRAYLSIDSQFYDIRFKPFTDVDGGQVDQAGQDRRVARIAGQFQYAISPTVALYTQAEFSQIDFDHTIVGTVEDSDSSGGRLIAGAQFTFAGYGSATVGLGYSIRDFKALGLKSVEGLSAEAQAEFYLSALTTISFQGGRRFSDTQFVSSRPYFQTFAGVRLDHALLRNLLVTGQARYSHQDYVGPSSKASTTQLSLSGRYLASRRFEIGVDATYNTRSRSATLRQPDISELRAQIRATVKL